MRIGIALPILVLASLARCGDGGGRIDDEGARVILRVEDTTQIARQIGTRLNKLVVTDGSGNTTEISTATSDFPIRVRLTSQRSGPQLVTADAYGILPDTDGSTNVIARGHATVDIDADDGEEILLALGVYCVGADQSCPPIAPAHGPCSIDGQCDDGVFCNGQERCLDGECRFDAIPCPYSADGCTISVCFEGQVQCYNVPNAGIEACTSEP